MRRNRNNRVAAAKRVWMLRAFALRRNSLSIRGTLDRSLSNAAPSITVHRPHHHCLTVTVALDAFFLHDVYCGFNGVIFVPRITTQS